MNKKVVLVLGIIITLCLVIGGKNYMDKQQEKETQEKQSAEQKIALYIVQNYEGVRKIEFKKLTQTNETGFWHLSADINNINKLNFSMRNLSSANKPTIRSNPDTFHLKERSKKGDEDLMNVEVLYSEGNQ
ncbi:hypothetical protein A5821_003260 [Enterococcus sp. 7F3_DIV0205]|uniref:Uncharacterized protein n=1 Tax=Candidatus Enterococcus palustris TaxID=1834189 RepID=A0AAQ3WBI4_9ENTE|nr:Csa1 family protein [Enterococcus sp. 7F3_DIV0205]OTN84142.1 hypothetical protein A5821_000068 [Enterococcus sp. 7F3_DIV0205]